MSLDLEQENMDEHDIKKIVTEVIENLKGPEWHIHSIAADFRECGIDYCVIGGMAVRLHNYLRKTENIDILVSLDTYPRIEQFLIGNGYTWRPSSDRHVYYEFLGGRLPINIYVEGDVQDDSTLPNPTTSRIQVQKIWYASLSVLITLKIRATDYGDVLELIKENELDRGFAKKLDSDVGEKFLHLFES